MWDWHHPRTVTCLHKFQPSVKSFDWQLFSSGLNICSAFPWWSHHLWRTRLHPLLGWSNQKPGSPLPCCAKIRVSTNTQLHHLKSCKHFHVILHEHNQLASLWLKARFSCHGPSSLWVWLNTMCSLPSKGGDFWEVRTFCLILNFYGWLKTWFVRLEVGIGFRLRLVWG